MLQGGPRGSYPAPQPRADGTIGTGPYRGQWESSWWLQVQGGLTPAGGTSVLGNGWFPAVTLPLLLSALFEMSCPQFHEVWDRPCDSAV